MKNKSNFIFPIFIAILLSEIQNANDTLDGYLVKVNPNGDTLWTKHVGGNKDESIHSIIEVKEESDIMSLFSEGETTALQDQISGLDDFELICFLVIK